jgi:hypothetical protein
MENGEEDGTGIECFFLRAPHHGKAALCGANSFPMFRLCKLGFDGSVRGNLGTGQQKSTAVERDSRGLTGHHIGSRTRSRADNLLVGVGEDKAVTCCYTC